MDFEDFGTLSSPYAFCFTVWNFNNCGKFANFNFIPKYWAVPV